MRRALPLVLAALLAWAGCGRDNGLPADLTAHVAERGIALRPSRVHAPLSGRDGYLLVPHDPGTAARLVAAFGLARVEPGSPHWRRAIERAGGAAAPAELWGVGGRPPQLRLRNGAQLEYLYLLVTADGGMYLLAEYAYG